MLSIFAMIYNLKGSVLHQHAMHVLVRSKASSRSWFITIRDLCLRYNLPHPLELLTSTLSKDHLKAMVRKQMVNYWELKLRAEAEPLVSLEYFHPEYMSLITPHPIWTTSGACSYQNSMSSVQATMISGRYRTELLCSNWSSNSGCCELPSCKDNHVLEDLQHILAVCSSLEPARLRLSNYTHKICDQFPEIKNIIQQYCTRTNPLFVQFLLDCSVLPEVILAKQEHGLAFLGPLFKISRTWCYCLHKTRLKLLDRWKNF